MKKVGLLIYIGIIICFFTGCETQNAKIYTGFIEVEMADIVPHASGKIAEIYIQEGDYVEKGTVIATIDQRSLQIKRAKLMSEIENQSLAYALLVDEIDDEDLKLIKIQLENLEDEMQLALSSTALINQNVIRKKALYEAGALPSEAIDEAMLTLEQAQTKEASLKHQIDQLTITYHSALEGVDERKLAQIDIAIDQLNKDLSQLDLEVENMAIKALKSGLVETLDISVDELCTMGQAVGEINAGAPYVIFYLDNTQLNKLAVGTKVTVWQDDGDHAYTAEIYDLASEAQFTPKNVTVKEDRQQLVYRVEARLLDTSGFLPGMMVDVILSE